MSEPIITFNNRTLRVEGENWHIEAKVLASGRQIAIRCDGTIDGATELIIRPDLANRIFISSRTSETAPEEPEPETKGEKRGRRTS